MIDIIPDKTEVENSNQTWRGLWNGDVTTAFCTKQDFYTQLNNQIKINNTFLTLNSKLR